MLVALAAEVIGAARKRLNPPEGGLEPADSVVGLLSFTGISPLTKEQFEHSRSRATRKVYESSEQFRLQVRERMLRIKDLQEE